MTGINSDRRKFLAASGTALTIAVAGCSGGGDGGDGDDGGSDTRDDVPDAVDSYLSDNDANGYDGTMVDETGNDSVTIEVGAGDNGFAFAPSAVVVDSGTTVTWEWTGEGGNHNVLAGDSSPVSMDAESELNAEEGHTAEHTFEGTDNYLYYCSVHTANGMYGAVVVE